MSIELPWLTEELIFPPVSSALTKPNGLLAVGGDLSSHRLLEAYRHGIFPWFSDDQPILWWSPDPRMVLFPEKLKISKSLAKKLKQKIVTVTVDTCFADVIKACALPRKQQAETWITEEMIAAYIRLHELGYAHSVEIWRDAKLVGGLYGIALGKVFFGESMFSFEADMSKIALVHLAKKMGPYQLIDCQQATSHLQSLGAETISRELFIKLLTKFI